MIIKDIVIKLKEKKKRIDLFPPIPPPPPFFFVRIGFSESTCPSFSENRILKSDEIVIIRSFLRSTSKYLYYIGEIFQQSLLSSSWPIHGRRGSRKTGRNLRARINFNRVINAAHRHGKIWIEHAAAREGRAKNNISVRLL